MINLIYMFIGTTIIMSFIFLYFKKKEDFLIKNKFNGVCAFDLDGTITCGIENAKKAIETCRKHNYKLAINTARPIKFYADIKFEQLGLSKEEVMDDFYYGDIYLCSFIDYECMINNIAETKVKHLETLCKKWNVEPEKVILLDDQHYNINKAKSKGFSVIHANNPVCGLPDDVIEQIEKLIILGNDSIKKKDHYE